MDKLTNLANFFTKVPAAFLVAIVTVLGLVLFLPEQHAKTLAVETFRDEYRVFLGPAFLLTLSFAIARLFLFTTKSITQKRLLKKKKEFLKKLTPEEKRIFSALYH